MDNNQDKNTLPDGIKPDVLSYDDIRRMVPFFDGKPKLVNFIMRLFAIDKVNYLHRHNCATPGAPFVAGLLRDLDIKLRIDNEAQLDNLPEGAFVTVSNHTFGALDGIILIHMLASRRPEFKVMVNMVLNYITAMRPNFIAVDALASNDPAKRAVSMKGITTALRHVKDGHPLGFFPAGAVSKITPNLRIEDRLWQPNIIRLIKKLKVPVVPIYFHGHNSTFFNILGLIDWRLRTLKLPSEVFRRHDETFRVSVGELITPEQQAQYPDIESLGEMLRNATYSLRKW